MSTKRMLSLILQSFRDVDLIQQPTRVILIKIWVMPIQRAVGLTPLRKVLFCVGAAGTNQMFQSRQLDKLK